MDSLRFSRGDYVSRALLTVHVSFVLILNESISSRLAIYSIVNYHYLENSNDPVIHMGKTFKRRDCIIETSPYLFYRTVYFEFPPKFRFRRIVVLKTNIFTNLPIRQCSRRCYYVSECSTKFYQHILLTALHGSRLSHVNHTYYSSYKKGLERIRSYVRDTSWIPHSNFLL